jgi:hypothetical protein
MGPDGYCCFPGYLIAVHAINSGGLGAEPPFVSKCGLAPPAFGRGPGEARVDMYCNFRLPIQSPNYSPQVECRSGRSPALPCPASTLSR